MGVRLNGATSGFVELNAPAVAGTTTLELPTDTLKSGLVLIATQSFTAASTVSVDNCFTSTYENYLVAVNASGSSDQLTYMRLRASGSDNTAASYNTQSLSANVSTVSTSRVSSGTTWCVGALSTNQNALSVNLYLPAVAVTTVFRALNSYASSGAYIFDQSGSHSVASSFDGFTVYPASGTITGSLQVYGYRKAL